MPTRVAFVGPSATLEASALHAPAGRLLPRRFAVRPDDEPTAVRAALEDWGAQVVVGLAGVPDGALAGLRALRLAHGVHRDDVDRVAAAAAAPDPAAWRTFPLPVDDRLFAEVRPSSRPPRIVFLGASTAHRERYLIRAKHEFDLVHYAHGLHGDRLRAVLASTDVGVVLHRERGAGFEPGALVHLAAGHLVLSEPLAPTFGLEPGLDFVAVAAPDELLTVLHQLRRRPDAFERVRLRGREKAEAHRAARVWPRVVEDLQRDVAAFGRSRRGSPSTTRS